ncbi:hypothetical protein LTR62_000744 [Meristemomyces frigidus]|uniref:Mediator of RNA polymerase II transcription subunit 1 n=1 Tax=Meristemomyces frigidus TaxID=1508187 RepID=A0AAN7YMR0_9PEZI|nr:hypothetical protein LTR62_000744 [Meristemomyces frigidus]
MATPTSSHPVQPGSASRRAAAHVSTPSLLALNSPAPRSVPSPAATRKEGKTPINHPTGSSQGSSKTIGSTPMFYGLSQTGNTASPIANMLSFGTPLGLGIESTTPGQLHMHTPAFGGMPMSLTMSELGMTPGAATQRRNEDDERRTKMRRVLRKIGHKSGRVTEEGILRVSRRIGFEDTHGDDKSLANRLISTAGKKVLVEIKLKDLKVERITIVLDTENARAASQNDALEKVLMHDLQETDDSEIDVDLSRFAANMSRLARIDRLSSHHLNTFEALSGIYTSLSRLYDQEMLDSNDLEVLLAKSGKPTLHADDRIGVAIRYWQRRDHSPEDKNMALPCDAHKLDIEIERSVGAIFPTLRISENWLPDPLELSTDASQDHIPWLDPPSTLMPVDAEGDGIAGTGEEKVPDLHFTAKLEPPLVLPWHMATNVLQSFGLQPPTIFVYPPAWHTMVLDISATTPFNAGGDSLISSEQSVLTMRNGEAIDNTHIYSLDIAKPDGGYLLNELPFSHPRQLVELLPTLRQWARFTRLFHDLFGVASKPRTKTNPDHSTAIPGISTVDELLNPPAMVKPDTLTLDSLLTPPVTPRAEEKVAISISIATTPTPTVSLTFPSRKLETMCNVILQVQSNGIIAVVGSSKVIGDGQVESHDDEAAKKRLAEALERCGDVGVWIEWLRGAA